MKYEEPVYRPPSEARSLIFQATVGCSNNTCTFCGMYKGKKFRIRPLDEVIEEIRSMEPYADQVQKVFFADGNVLCLPTASLLALLKAVNNTFPQCRRISLYGAPGDVLGKSKEELKELADAGLSMVYMGLESGSGAVLEETRKGATPEMLTEAGLKMRQSPIELSVTLISGLGGKKRWEEHALQSAHLVNAVQPEYVSLLTLMVTPETKLYSQVEAGEFELLDPNEVLKETRLFVEKLNLENARFSSNHASNYVPLSAQLPGEKEKILAILDEAIEGRRGIKSESLRGL